MRGFLLGFRCFFKGHMFALREKPLRRIIFLSYSLNAFIFCILCWFGLGPAMAFLSGALPFPEVWYFIFLEMLVKAFFVFVILLASATFVYVISSFFLVGWGTLLARRTLMAKCPQELKTSGPTGFYFLIRRIIPSLLKSVFVASLSLVFYMVSFIPVVGLIGLVMVTLLLTFDMMDYGFDELGLTIRNRFSFYSDHILEAAGFSVALGMMMAIPFLNVMILPGSIVAANYLLAEIKGRVERTDSQEAG